jgi:hypothetical protein
MVQWCMITRRNMSCVVVFCSEWRKKKGGDEVPVTEYSLRSVRSPSGQLAASYGHGLRGPGRVDD